MAATMVMMPVVEIERAKLEIIKLTISTLKLTISG